MAQTEKHILEVRRDFLRSYHEIPSPDVVPRRWIYIIVSDSKKPHAHPAVMAKIDWNHSVAKQAFAAYADTCLQFGLSVTTQPV